jgi:hypothetical protein
MVEGTVPALVWADDWLAAQPERAPAPKGTRAYQLLNLTCALVQPIEPRVAVHAVDFM